MDQRQSERDNVARRRTTDEKVLLPRMNQQETQHPKDVRAGLSHDPTPSTIMSTASYLPVASGVIPVSLPRPELIAMIQREREQKSLLQQRSLASMGRLDTNQSRLLSTAPLPSDSPLAMGVDVLNFLHQKQQRQISCKSLVTINSSSVQGVFPSPLTMPADPREQVQNSSVMNQHANQALRTPLFPAAARSLLNYVASRGLADTGEQVQHPPADAQGMLNHFASIGVQQQQRQQHDESLLLASIAEENFRLLQQHELCSNSQSRCPEDTSVILDYALRHPWALGSAQPSQQSMLRDRLSQTFMAELTYLQSLQQPEESKAIENELLQTLTVMGTPANRVNAVLPTSVEAWGAHVNLPALTFQAQLVHGLSKPSWPPQDPTALSLSSRIYNLRATMAKNIHEAVSLPTAETAKIRGGDKVSIAQIKSDKAANQALAAPAPALDLREMGPASFGDVPRGLKTLPPLPGVDYPKRMVDLDPNTAQMAGGKGPTLSKSERSNSNQIGADGILGRFTSSMEVKKTSSGESCETTSTKTDKSQEDRKPAVASKDCRGDEKIDESSSAMPDQGTANQKKIPRKRRPYRHESFPEKLHRLLREVTGTDKEKIVCFSDSGKGFFIHDSDLFVTDIVPNYFRQRQMSSFRRQLVMYGFSRIQQGPEDGAFTHSLFRRDQPDLCKQIERVGHYEQGKRW